MSFVAVAIGGSALIGAGASLYTGTVQAGAAKEAAGAQSDAYRTAANTSVVAGRDALAYLDPYRQYGLNAGATLESMLYSPDQRLQQIDSQKAQLQSEVDRLKALVPDWNTYPVLSGKNASERRLESFTNDYNTAQTKLKEAQAKLDSFNQQVPALQAQAQSGGPKVQESPWYQFQSQLLSRNMDRYFAARGLTGSGFEAESNRQGQIQLGAQETENQYNRLAAMYGIGANASTAGAGAITGTSQGVANAQIGSGQAQAQGLVGSANANANAATGFANAANGAVGGYLNYNLFQNLLSRNKPMSGASAAAPVASAPTGTGTIDSEYWNTV